jgi:hypothetical protein
MREWLLSLVTLQPQNQGLQGDGTPLSAPEPPELLEQERLGDYSAWWFMQSVGLPTPSTH